MQSNPESWLLQVERIRAANILGDGRVRQMFDYLVACAATSRVPKEVEVAVDIFGKLPTADLSQDASVRVCVYNLRRRLNQYYSGPGRQESERLALLKGEYRLALMPNAQETDAQEDVAPQLTAEDEVEALADAGQNQSQNQGQIQSQIQGQSQGQIQGPGSSQNPVSGPDFVADSKPDQSQSPVTSGVFSPLSSPAQAGPDSGAPRGRRRWWATAATLLLGLGLGLFVAWADRPAPDGAARARSAPFWASMLKDNRPVLLVIGDYYIFGDTGGPEFMSVERLIRDFSINSKSDLQRYLLTNPSDMDRYQDVGLSYLPTSSAYALLDLLPVLTDVRSRLKITLASELDPTQVKSSNIIYVGLLSGMGMLQRTVFANSRFQFGDSFDELVDGETHQKYVSQAVHYADEHFSADDSGVYRDYGYLSSFIGPAGNRIIVVAGMQDEGLRQTVDYLTNRTNLNQLEVKVGKQHDFEGLMEVAGLERQNLSGKLLLVNPREAPVVTAAK